MITSEFFKTTEFFKGLNVSDDTKKEALALKQTMQAYNAYKHTKLNLEVEVSHATADLELVRGEVELDVTPTIEAKNYTSSEAYMAAHGVKLAKEETNKVRVEEAQKVVDSAKMKLIFHENWGKSQGFEVEEA